MEKKLVLGVICKIKQMCFRFFNIFKWLILFIHFWMDTSSLAFLIAVFVLNQGPVLFRYHSQVRANNNRYLMDLFHFSPFWCPSLKQSQKGIRNSKWKLIYFSSKFNQYIAQTQIPLRKYVNTPKSFYVSTVMYGSRQGRHLTISVHFLSRQFHLRPHFYLFSRMDSNLSSLLLVSMTSLIRQPDTPVSSLALQLPQRTSGTLQQVPSERILKTSPH
jgi:hypothetical protein